MDNATQEVLSSDGTPLRVDESMLTVSVAVDGVDVRQNCSKVPFLNFWKGLISRLLAAETLGLWLFRNYRMYRRDTEA